MSSSNISQFEHMTIADLRKLTEDYKKCQGIIKKQGHNVEETYNVLCKDKRVQDFIDENKREKRKILENLKISTHARFGENNTANKL